MSTTHTHNNLDYYMIPTNLVHHYQYSLKSNSTSPSHHVIFEDSITVAPILFLRKNACHFFYGKQKILNKLYQTGIICLATMKFNHEACFEGEFLLHAVLSIHQDYQLDDCLALDLSGSSFIICGMTHHSCTNFKCEITYVKKWVFIHFRGTKCVYVEYDQLFNVNIS